MLFTAADPFCHTGKYLRSLFMAGTAKKNRCILSFFDSKLVPGINLMEYLFFTVNYNTGSTLRPLYTTYIPVSGGVVYSSKDKGSNHRLCPACIINNPVPRFKPPVFLKLLPLVINCLITGEEVISVQGNNLRHPGRAVIQLGQDIVINERPCLFCSKQTEDLRFK